MPSWQRNVGGVKKNAVTVVVLVVLALVYWKAPHLLESEREGRDVGTLPGEKTRIDQVGLDGADGGAANVEKEGDYAVFRNCEWLDRRGNDGDSFWVRFPNGAERQVRLYFVDAPESSFKTYRGGDNNGKRIYHQGEYFGGLDQDETTELGEQAKEAVKDLLEGQAFTILTKFEAVFDSGRIFVFLRTDDGYLHETLVRKGLVRIYTEGDTLPDGTSERAQKSRLKDLEKVAKRAGAGGWGR